MKILVFGGIVAAILGYAWTTRTPADVYDLRPADAYTRLAGAKMPTPDGTTGVFYMLEPSISGNGRDKVTVNAASDQARFECAVSLAPEGDARTKLAVSCDGAGAGNGAAGGLVSNMLRKRFIEWVDATMDGREFDPASSSVAHGWPDDVAAHGSLNSAT